MHMTDFCMSLQTLAQQFLRRPEGNDALLAYQAGPIHGALGTANFAAASGSMQLPQQPRKFIDLGQQHGSPNIPEQSHNRSQGVDQQMMQQAYLQYAFQSAQAAQQKSTLGMQSQQQVRPAMFGSHGKDQEMRMANIKMQELISMQAANQSPASSSKKPSEQVVQSDKHADNSHRPGPDQRSESKLNHPALVGQGIQSAPMQAPQSQQNIPNITNNQIAMAAQMQAMQAMALERNIDLSHPANANMVAQLIPLMQSRMVAQQKANENSSGMPSVSFPKQHVTSPPVGNESSPHGNSSSDVSGQSGSSKARQAVSPSTLGGSSNATLPNNSSSIPAQQFSVHHLPPRQPSSLGHLMPPMHPSQPSGNLSQGVDNFLAKTTVPEASQAQNARQSNRSPQQSAPPSNEGDVGNPSTSQGGPSPQMRQSHTGFTKQQLHVLKAQILAFRRLKVRTFSDTATPSDIALDCF